jgi:hypothetical protein
MVHQFVPKDNIRMEEVGTSVLVDDEENQDNREIERNTESGE